MASDGYWLSLDTETALIRPGLRAPELVCVTHAAGDGYRPGILHHTEAHDFVKYAFEERAVVGQTIAFDALVCMAAFPDLVPVVFEAYNDNRVTCTKIRQQLFDIAAGQYRGYKDAKGVWHEYTYDLAALAKRNLGKHVAKTKVGKTGELEGEDTWRLRYHELRNVPLESWPEDARAYAIEDAVTTFDVFQAQEKHLKWLDDQFRRARYKLALDLIACWGIRTDRTMVEKLERDTDNAFHEIGKRLGEWDIVRQTGSKAGSVNLKAAKAHMISVCREQGAVWVKTDGHLKCDKGDQCDEHVSLAGQTCEATGDPVLQDYADFVKMRYVKAKDIPLLKSGAFMPIHTNFDLAETGRTTSANPPLQNLRVFPGIRECFMPRAGKVYAQADYESLELYCLAQACLDLGLGSRLADYLRQGIDLHTELACRMVGIPYEEGVRLHKAKDEKFGDERAAAKRAMYGLPGGMGYKRFIAQARKFGLHLDLDKVKILKATWQEMLPEMVDYHAFMSGLVESGGSIVYPRSNRVMGGVGFCDACNGFYQGIGADATQHAMWLIIEACYNKPESVLFGSRVVNYVHDEFIVEVDDDERAHDKAMELSRLMEVGAKVFLPDITPTAPPCLMRQWSKKALAVFENGRLVPWSP